MRGATTVWPPRERLRLADLRGFRDGDGEIALRHRHRRHAHVAAHDDDPGALVDDHLGGEIGIDLQLLDLRQQRDHVVGGFLRQRDLHRRGVERLGDRGADIVVDGGGDPLGGREVGVAQGQPHLVELVERELDLALDDGAVGDPAHGRHAAHDLGGFAFGLEAADGDRALRDRIDVAVGAEQRGDQQGSALQALGIAERRNRHVDAGALGAERRQIARHHDGRHVSGADGGAADVDAEPLQHGLQRLLGEREYCSAYRRCR